MEFTIKLIVSPINNFKHQKNDEQNENNKMRQDQK